MSPKILRNSLDANIILGVGAHADDLDFSAAGTIAQLASEGAEIYYLILTDGSKGSADPDVTTETLVSTRQKEQLDAAKLLGVREVFFLDYEDGALEVTQDLKKDIVRHIRQIKPDVVFCFDPTMVYDVAQNLINHPDHRACGQAVLDAAYPLARDRLSFPELYVDGLEPHKVKTLMLTNFEKQNYFVDISQTFERKMEAIAAHTSQVSEMARVRLRFTTSAAELGKQIGCTYAEAFVRIDIKV